jgi:hypothetical protein
LEDERTFVHNTEGRQGINDLRKLEAAKRGGVTLITIPYWWKHSEKFVKDEVVAKRPDMITFLYHRNEK